MAPFEFRSVNRIVCEAGSTLKLGELIAPTLQQLGSSSSVRVFFLVDPYIQSTAKFQEVLSGLEKAGHSITVCSKVEPDPPEHLVLEVTQKAIDCQAQVVIGLGGGSTLDVAKLVAVLALQQQDLKTMYGVGMVTSRRLPLVLAPTTSGTGSEVTHISIVTTGADTKMGVVSPVLYPDLAVLDADWTLSLPQHVTAATGIDAMVHAIEAFTSKRLKNKYSDFLACEALRLLSTNLNTVCKEPDNREARQAMMLGACLAGQAFANAPVGGVHALAYPIGGIFHVPHGLSNSLVLPEVLKFNAPIAQDLYAELADVVGSSHTISNPAKSAKCESFVRWCANLSPSTGLPSRLRDVGIGEADVAIMADAAMLQTRLLSNNPREINREDAFNIYSASW